MEGPGRKLENKPDHTHTIQQELIVVKRFHCDKVQAWIACVPEPALAEFGSIAYTKKTLARQHQLNFHVLKVTKVWAVEEWIVCSQGVIISNWVKHRPDSHR